MEIRKIYPEYYRTVPHLQWGSPAFRGAQDDIFNFLPQGMNPGVFEVKKAVEKIKQLDEKVDKNPFSTKFILPALGVLPMVRRVESVPDKFRENNPEGAAAQVAVAGLNIFGDGREVGLAIDEGKNIYNAVKTKNWTGLKDIFKWKGQHAMTMLDGTVADGLVPKSPLLQKINNFDDVIYNTGFGRFLQDKLKLEVDLEKTIIKERKPLKILFTNKEINPLNTSIRMHNFKGNFLKKWVSGALHRISKLNLITSAAIEIPALIRSVTKTEGTTGDKVKAFGKQLIKSTGFVIAVNTAIALAGAAIAPATFIGGLAVMALGSAVGISASKEFNKLVDKVIS